MNSPARRRPLVRALLALALLAGAAGSVTACTSADSATTTSLSVLAGSELGDLRAVLDELHGETGIRLNLELRGTMEASDALASGRAGGYDLAWLSSDRWLRLALAGSGAGTSSPLATQIMRSPLAIGVKRSAAARLHLDPAGGAVTWSDIARAAGTTGLRYAMADPRVSEAGLSALVAVATAAAGTGAALRPEDVREDRLRGFLAGRTLTAPSTTELVEAYLGAQDGTDALIANESELLALGSDKRLREPVDIIYPQDGMVLSDYPLLLLDQAKRPAYDRVVHWLLTPSAQKRIMRLTLRRPVDAGIPRDPRLDRAIGNALYFPDRPEVVRSLLAQYEAAASPAP
ncbi:hypothetical protein ACFCX4_08310 [Kitasatospora sp. NPDC056327]|uniref:hypothetical protein n=1 Tax=Kitasatospora sp. NPDC056327 TaxID=3345785 RepID=UPI0035E16A6B